MTSRQKTRDTQIAAARLRRTPPCPRGPGLETTVITYDRSYEVFLRAGGFSG